MNHSTSSESMWVGIDVSKAKLDLALLDGRGKYKNKVFANTAAGHVQLMDWLVQRGAAAHNTRVCLEATGCYSEGVAVALCDAHWHVSVVNPARVKGFAQSELSRNKTDTADAALLARFCAAMRPEPWQAPPLEVRQLRALVDRKQVLMDMHQQESNRLEGHEHSDGRDVLVSSIHSHLAWLRQCIKELEGQIDDHIDGHPQLKQDADLIKSIPGLGETTAAKVLAFVGDVRRFSTAKALAAYVGVTPRLRQSGSALRGHTIISRSGHTAMRAALYMPAMVALKHNQVIKAFGQRLATKGLTPKAVIAASMHKLVHIIYGVVRSGLPFNPLIAMPPLDFQDGI